MPRRRLARVQLVYYKLPSSASATASQRVDELVHLGHDIVLDQRAKGRRQAIPTCQGTHGTRRTDTRASIGR